MNGEIPLIVDVDETLLRTDLLYESLLRTILYHPLTIFVIPFVALQGKAQLKRFLASYARDYLGELPINEDILDLLTAEKAKGRSIYLASASDEELVRAVGDSIGIFDGIIGTKDGVNLKGATKAIKLCEKFGEKKFDYIGDSTADLPVWKRARKGYVYTSRDSLFKKAKAENSEVELVRKDSVALRSILRAMRPYQWIKNILLFVPFLMAHGWDNYIQCTWVMRAFISFSLVASSVYLLNDLLDLAADRAHFRKRTRPLASGALPIPTGMLVGIFCFALGFLIGAEISLKFLAILAGYYVVTCVYSLYVKRIVLLDIITLASLYTIRIFAGSIAANVFISQWALAFSMFIFFSLACVKRYSELYDARRKDKIEPVVGRGYVPHDLECISQFGSASGYIAILVLALYINSREVAVLYRNPNILWFVCPLLFYWISRVWLLATRGGMHDDPIVFALGDTTSYIVGLLLMSSVIFAL